jgi:hypothetical protein
MNRIRPMFTFACVGAAATFTVAALLGFLMERRATSFESLQQACEGLRAAGYHCISDRHDGTIATSFIVSRDRMTWNDATAMYMHVWPHGNVEGARLGHSQDANCYPVYKPGQCRSSRLGRALGIRR